MNKLEKYDLAYQLVFKLSNCETVQEIKVAGSIRRLKENPKDIEICALVEKPKPIAINEKDLFSETTYTTPKFNAELINKLESICDEKIKGAGKYCQFRIDDVMIDYFQTDDPNQWGMLYFIRTGPHDFNRMCLNRWKELKGFDAKLSGNILQDKFGKKYPAQTEEEVFEHLQLDYIKPNERK